MTASFGLLLAIFFLSTVFWLFVLYGACNVIAEYSYSSSRVRSHLEDVLGKVDKAVDRLEKTVDEVDWDDDFEDDFEDDLDEDDDMFDGHFPRQEF